MNGLETQEFLKSRIESLPKDIMHNIFSRLPLKSVIQFSCVCKSWLRIIRDPDFGELHLSKSESEPAMLILTYDIIGDKKVINISYMKQEGLEVVAGQSAIVNMISPHYWNLVGTCDGLLCFVTSRRQEIVMVCNPVTREHVILPKPSLCPKLHRVMHAFGLDPITKKYKVLRIVCRRNIRILAEVYTLGDAGYWREVRGFNHVPRWRSVYAKGAVHWLVDPYPAANYVDPHINMQLPFPFHPYLYLFPAIISNYRPHDQYSNQRERILSFDLGKEEFRMMQHTRIGRESRLAELDKRLSIVDTSSGTLAEVSVMRDSWKKEYILPIRFPPLQARPSLMCAHEHNGVLLIWLEDSHEDILVTYNSKEFARKDLKLAKLPTWLNWKTCGCYRGSFVSLRHFKSADENYRSDIVGFVSDQEIECRRREQDTDSKSEDIVGEEDGMLH